MFWRESVSFDQQYNSRVDPNYPTKGKASISVSMFVNAVYVLLCLCLVSTGVLKTVTDLSAF